MRQRAITEQRKKQNSGGKANEKAVKPRKTEDSRSRERKGRESAEGEIRRGP